MTDDSALHPEVIEFLKNFREHSGYNPEDLNECPQKLISCAHELVFTITANVLEENDKGETVGSKEICVKNYHIPVPIGKDYNIFMTGFFKYLEQCLASSAKQAYTNKDNLNE